MIGWREESGPQEGRRQMRVRDKQRKMIEKGLAFGEQCNLKARDQPGTGQLMKSDRKKEAEGKTRERNGGRPLRLCMFGCFSFPLSDVDLYVISKECVSLCISSSRSLFPLLNADTHTLCALLSCNLFPFPTSRKIVVGVTGLFNTLWQC